MLHSKSFVAPPAFTEKSVKVRILKPIYVAGKATAIGDTASMSLSDAQALCHTRPATVEIL